MSYDLNVWSINRPEIPASLPTSHEWETRGDFAVYTRQDWQITISQPARVLDEDVADGVSELLPGIEYFTELSLRPIDTPGRARKLLERTATHIAKLCTGVVEDPQLDIVKTPGGVSRFERRRHEKDERFSILEICYWFINPQLDDSAVWPALIDYFKRRLPEALPKRYGTCEPPQRRYEETGDQHLLQFLDEHKYDFPICYPHPPVTDVYLSLEPKLGFIDKFGQRMLKVNRFRIGADADALKQLGWSVQMRRVWMELATLLRPFYGDVRVLDNFIRGYPSVAVDSWTESHPATGPSWSGIPSRVGQAVVVGEPYLSLWPALNRFGVMKDGMRFVSTGDWLQKVDATEIIGEVPRDIGKRGEVWLELVLGFFSSRSN